VRRKKTKWQQKIRPVLKGWGFCSFGNGSNAAEVDVKDGKVVVFGKIKIQRVAKIKCNKKDEKSHCQHS